MKTKDDSIPKLRFGKFPISESWNRIPIGEIITTITPPKKIQSSYYKREGKYPIIDQSIDYICGYSNDDDAVVNKDGNDVIIFGDHTCVIKFVDFPFVQGADGIKIIKSLFPDKIDIKYLYQYLLFSPIVSKEYKRHFSDLKEKLILYPVNIEYQRKIANSLFIIDKELELQAKKIELLEQQKKGLFQQLLPQ